MIFDEKRQDTAVTTYPQVRSYKGAFVAISMFLAFLFVADLYTLNRLNAARHSQESLRSALAKEIRELKNRDEQLSSKFSLVEVNHAREIDALRRELDVAAERLGSSTGQVLDRARAMVAALQKNQQREGEDVKDELSRKADADDVGMLSENVSEAEGELGTTKKTVDVLTKDLGMARSELGTLLSSSRSEIQTLRQLADRDVHEFTLMKNRQNRVAGVALILKSTNVRAQSFTLNLIANDREIQNKNRNVDEPIWFYPGGSKVPYELVINEVDHNMVKGYVSTPKAAIQEEDVRANRDS